MATPIVAILITTSMVSALSAVRIDGSFSLKDGDLGLEEASISPDGGIVVVHGSEAEKFENDSKRPENFS